MEQWWNEIDSVKSYPYIGLERLPGFIDNR
jgi:hypothetical protein